ncbi:substrate-binding periplasmic protein [Deinococcus alpinitundrae]|uniref:substrate-binding periplasmic protein n=1 Tax=Deinococcus alpinitundrae TaxID=468913 RepID=UPI001379A586|nr:ABC transporter substrate-binding protein [Deinococcus alpinitundrae]
MSITFKSALLPLVVSALTLALPAQARSLTEIRQEGILHVSSLDLPPLSYKADGGYTGFETELLTMLAGDLNLKVDFTSAALDTMMADLQGGRTDMAIGGLGITSTRENKVDFTRPFLCAGMSVVARNPAIQTRFDLENRNIGVLSGSTIQAFVQKLPFPKRAQVFPTANAVIYAVATGQVDASLAYQLMEPVMAKLYPKSGVHFGPVQWSIPVGAMLPDRASSLRLALNGALAKTMRDGRYEQLSTRYFGTDLRCKA